MTNTTVSTKTESGLYTVTVAADAFDVNGPNVMLEVSQSQLDSIYSAAQSHVTNPGTGGASKIVFFGDSVTFGTNVTPSQAYPALVGSARGFDTVVNKGVYGNNTNQAMARFQADVLDQHPTALCIMFGINDSVQITAAAYEANLNSMVTQAQGAGISVTLCTPTVAQDANVKSHIRDFIDAACRVGTRSGVTLVDMYRDWALAAIELPLAGYNALYTDWAHPSVSGHQRIATYMAQNPKACAR